MNDSTDRPPPDKTKSFVREVGEGMIEDGKAGLRSILYAGGLGALVGSIAGWIAIGPMGSLVLGVGGFVVLAGVWTYILWEA